MKTRLQIFTIAAAITALALGSTAYAQSDDKEKMPEAITVLKKFADVTGGAANYKKVKAIKMSGTLEIAVAGINGTIEILQVTPDKMATKAEMDQVGSQSQGTNGKVGWDVSTMMGPRVLEENELERLKDQANLARIYDPAKYYKEMEVVGTEETNGEKCYKLKMTKQNGDESIEFYSVESGLQISSTSTMETQMGAMEIQSFVSDYKEVGGIKLPHKLEVKFPNGMVQAVAFDKVEVNPKVDEKMFEVPEEVKALLPNDDEKSDEKSEGEDK